MVMGNIELNEEGETVKRTHRLFLDDIEYQAFVRRLQWSPDGNLLLTPSACFYDISKGRSTNLMYTVYGFLKHNLSQPAFMLPGIKSYATCIRFNPHLYELSRSSNDTALLDLPYKMVFAVATTDQVLIYTTDKI